MHLFYIILITAAIGGLAIASFFALFLILPSIIAGIRAEKYIKRGEKALKRENYQEAIKQYNTACSIAPKNPDIPWRLGGLYIATGDYEKAIDCCKTAISLDSQSSYPFFNLASAYREIGDKEGLKRTCEEYLERFSDIEQEKDVNLIRQWLQEGK